jgi:DNA repair exonuclease SbcCD ATPase subunit
VFETRTGRLVNTATPGEYFLGVSEQVFEKTAFFKQLTVPSGKDEYIAEQLQNIAMSADEKINTTKALKRLTDARNMLSGRAKSGLIPKFEAERETLEQRISEAADTNRQIQELSDKIAESEKTIKHNGEIIKKLTDERENISKYEAFQRLTQIRELEKNEEKSKKDYEEARKQLQGQELPAGAQINAMLTLNAEYKSELRAKEKLFDELQKEEAELQSMQNSEGLGREEAEEIKAKAKKKTAFGIAFSVLAVLFAVAGVFLVFLFAAAAISAVIAVVGFTSAKKVLKTHNINKMSDLEFIISGYPLMEQRIAEKKNKVAAVNNAYSELVTKIEAMKKQLEVYITQYTEINNAMSYEEQIEFISETAQKIRQKLTVYKTAYETREKATAAVNMQTLMNEAEGAVRPEREKAKVEQELNFYTQQTAIFEKKLRESEGQKKYLEGRSGDLAVLTGKRDAVKTRLEEYKKKYASLELAIKMLGESSDYMKSTVAPRINAYASDYFGNATNGKYDTLSVDTTMAMSFSDNMGTKSCDYLSAGTRDSAYLCLRLALIRLLYGNVNPPLVLDDAFGRLDDARLEALLTLLAEATDCQTFIFTCGDREEKLLKATGKDYTELSLGAVKC